MTYYRRSNAQILIWSYREIVNSTNVSDLDANDVFEWRGGVCFLNTCSMCMSTRAAQERLHPRKVYRIRQIDEARVALLSVCAVALLQLVYLFVLPVGVQV